MTEYQKNPNGSPGMPHNDGLIQSKALALPALI